MNEKNNELKLFSERSDEYISLDDEEIILEEDDSRFQSREPRFGGKNIFFICIILLLAAATVFLMSFDFRTAPENTSSADESEASQTLAENESVIEHSVNISPDESILISREESEQSEETSETEEPFHGWIINNLGYTYLYYGMGVEQFNYSDATLSKYINCIDSLSAQVPDGVRVYCMPIPTRVGFLYNEISNDIKREDNFYNSLQETFLDTLEESLQARTSFINLYDSFEEEYVAGSELYFNTDLNWTSDAAYLAYKQFCAASGHASSAIEAYEQKTIEGFLGSFYTATQSEILKENADVFRYYKNAYTDACTVTLYSGKSVYKNYTLMNNSTYGAAGAYSVYLGTSGQHFKIETSNTSGEKLLVVGDGSAAAMMPFLVTNYSEIHYIDIALYQDSFSSMFDETEFDEVLFACYVTNAVKGTYPNHLATMAGVTSNE